jgi:hypothetical protein
MAEPGSAVHAYVSSAVERLARTERNEPAPVYVAHLP